MKRYITFILALLLVLSFAGYVHASNGTVCEASWTAAKSGDDGAGICLSAEQSKMISDAIASCKWTIGTSDCLSDYVFTRNDGSKIFYHSDCGTFNDTAINRSYSVTGEKQSQINKLLNSIFSVTYADALKNDTKFTDIDASAWYYSSVKYVLDNGLMNGEGNNKFNPDGTLTRAMLCQILYNKSGCPAPLTDAVFADVNPKAWYSNAIRWATQCGLVTGYGDGYFGPTDAITREQTAAILYKYAKYTGVDTANGTGDVNTLSYDDVFYISDWAQSAMHWAVSCGIVTGKGDNILDPGGYAKRCEVAAMVMHYLESEGKKADKTVAAMEDKTKTLGLATGAALELFYSDDSYDYYYPSVRSGYVVVKYSCGAEETVKKALADGAVKISDLDSFGIQYYKEPKSADGGKREIRKDRCDLYLKVLEDLWEVDSGLNGGILKIGIDLSDLTDLTAEERLHVATEFAAKHDLPFIEGTWEELCNQGYIDKKNLYWEDGLFFCIKTNEDAEWNLPCLKAGDPVPELTCFDAYKWRSGLGAYYFCECSAQRNFDGTWSYSVGAEVIS